MPSGDRDSPLARLLGPLLRGNNHTTILAAVSTDPEHVLDAVNTLRSSTRGKLPARTVCLCHPCNSVAVRADIPTCALPATALAICTACHRALDVSASDVLTLPIDHLLKLRPLPADDPRLERGGGGGATTRLSELSGHVHSARARLMSLAPRPATAELAPRPATAHQRGGRGMDSLEAEEGEDEDQDEKLLAHAMHEVRHQEMSTFVQLQGPIGLSATLMSLTART